MELVEVVVYAVVGPRGYKLVRGEQSWPRGAMAMVTEK